MKSVSWARVFVLRVFLPLACGTLAALFYVRHVPSDKPLLLPAGARIPASAFQKRTFDFLSHADNARVILPSLVALSTSPAQAYAEFLKEPALRDNPSPPWVSAATLGPEDLRVRRRALWAPLPVQFEYALTVSSASVLEFHWGFQAKGTRQASAASVWVKLTDDQNNEQVLFSSAVAVPRQRWWRRAPPRESPWGFVRCALGEWAGRNIKVTFGVDPSLKPGASMPQVFWAQPALWAAREAREEAADSLFVVTADRLAEEVWAPMAANVPWAKNIRAFLFEGVRFQRAYASGTGDGRGVVETLRSSPGNGTYVETWRQKGVRSVLVGAAGPENENDAAGFDEVRLVPAGPLQMRRAVLAAVRWLAENREREPFVLVVGAGALPDGQWPPPRFWKLAWDGWPATLEKFKAWRSRARWAYLDEHLGPLIDTADDMDLWKRAIASFYSLRGEEPLRSFGFSEKNIRVLWGVRHRLLPANQALSGAASLSSSGALWEQLAGVPPAAPLGPRGEKKRFADLKEWGKGPVVVWGRRGKAVVLDGHYKYIYQNRGRRGPQEEVYNLWNDPQETRNRALEDRELLSRLRRALEFVDPNPVETRLLFWDLKDKPLSGMVSCPGGEFARVESTAQVSRPWPGTVDFKVTGSSGTLLFETNPPNAAFVLRLLWDGKYLPWNRMRVSKFGLPLTELSGEEWFDSTKFDWMEGLSTPLPGESGPLVFVGRVPVNREDEQ